MNLCKEVMQNRDILFCDFMSPGSCELGHLKKTYPIYNDKILYHLFSSQIESEEAQILSLKIKKLRLTNF